MKTCPFCGEEIQEVAIVCKHCGRELLIMAPPLPVTPASRLPAPAPTASAPAPLKAGEWNRNAVFAILGGVLLVLLSSATVAPGLLLMWYGIGSVIPGGKPLKWAGGFVVATGFSMIGAGLAGHPITTPQTSNSTPSATATVAPRASTPDPPPPAEPKYDLALIDARGEKSSNGFFEVHGQVVNLTDHPLHFVGVVAMWYDTNNEFIRKDEALIDYKTLLPGQTSPFSTMSTGNPEMSRFRVDFKDLMGGTLRFDDRRK